MEHSMRTLIRIFASQLISTNYLFEAWKLKRYAINSLDDRVCFQLVFLKFSRNLKSINNQRWWNEYVNSWKWLNFYFKLRFSNKFYILNFIHSIFICWNGAQNIPVAISWTRNVTLWKIFRLFPELHEGEWLFHRNASIAKTASALENITEVNILYGSVWQYNARELLTCKMWHQYNTRWR